MALPAEVQQFLSRGIGYESMRCFLKSNEAHCFEFEMMNCRLLLHKVRGLEERLPKELDSRLSAVRQLFPEDPPDAWVARMSPVKDCLVLVIHLSERVQIETLNRLAKPSDRKLVLEDICWLMSSGIYPARLTDNLARCSEPAASFFVDLKLVSQTRSLRRLVLGFPIHVQKVDWKPLPAIATTMLADKLPDTIFTRFSEIQSWYKRAWSQNLTPSQRQALILFWYNAIQLMMTCDLKLSPVWKYYSRRKDFPLRSRRPLEFLFASPELRCVIDIQKTYKDVLQF